MSAVSAADQPGVCSPCGEPGVSYWDPAGLANGLDEAGFRQYQQAELKHGRVCMLAVFGLLVQSRWRFTDDFTLVPSGTSALSEESVGGFFGLIILAAGLFELRNTDDGRAPGDFGDPASIVSAFNLNYEDDDDIRNWRTFELNHGRLAMVGFLGAVSAEYATGMDPAGQWRGAAESWMRGASLTLSDAPVLPFSLFTVSDVPA